MSFGTNSRPLVVAVRIVWLQHAQAVLDGDSGRDHQEAARESGALGPANCVDRLPGDQHRHDGGLSGAGRQLESQPRQVRIGVVIGVREMVEEFPAGPARARRNLGEPNGGLDRFNLAEEGLNATESVVPPVLEQPGSLRGDLPLALVRQVSPPLDLSAHPVDDCRQVVLLAFGLDLLRSLIEHDGGLFG